MSAAGANRTLRQTLFDDRLAPEAERAASETVIVDVRMMGASGRPFMTGEPDNLRLAPQTISETLRSMKGLLA